jgi:hypothetical protein
MKHQNYKKSAIQQQQNSIYISKLPLFMPNSRNLRPKKGRMFITKQIPKTPAPECYS